MAFLSKVGAILRQSANKQISSELSPFKLYIHQATRCMSSMPSSKLFIGGISYQTDEQSLKEAFAKYGEVVDARIITDRETGNSRGFGFITFSRSEEASSAIQALDGQDLHGRRVRVNYATDRPRPSYGDGNFGGGGGYSGGSYGGGGGGGYGGGNYGGGGGGYGGGNYGGGQGNTYGENSSYTPGNYASGDTGFGNSGGYNAPGGVGGADTFGNSSSYGAPGGVGGADTFGAGDHSGAADTFGSGDNSFGTGGTPPLGEDKGSFGFDVNDRDDDDTDIMKRA